LVGTEIIDVQSMATADAKEDEVTQKRPK
jgi:hypothetical protein